MSTLVDSEFEIWGRYPSYDEIARFEYGRRMWRRPRCAPVCSLIGPIRATHTATALPSSAR